MNSHKRDEYKRKLVEQRKEIAELKAHVERLTYYAKEVVDWGDSIVGVYDNPNCDEQQDDIKNLRGVAYSSPAQSLQEHDRQVILEMVNSGDIPLWHDRRFIQVEDIEWYANNLTKGDDDE